MADLKSMLTESAFTIPGTKQKIPRWAVLAAGGGLIVLLLLAKRQQSVATEEGEAGEAGEVGAGGVYEDIPELPPGVPEEIPGMPGEPAPSTPDPGSYSYIGPSGITERQAQTPTSSVPRNYSSIAQSQVGYDPAKQADFGASKSKDQKVAPAWKAPATSTTLAKSKTSVPVPSLPRATAI